MLLVCLGREPRSISITNTTPQPVAGVRQADHVNRKPRPVHDECRPKAPVCCVTCATGTRAVPSQGRPNWIQNSKLVILSVWVVLGRKSYLIDGYMDTGASVSIMSESTAKSLKIDYDHEAPTGLIPLGGVDLKPIGYVAQLPLRTECGKRARENFYVVADHQMGEKKDCYLGLDLIQAFGHLVRLECNDCDR